MNDALETSTARAARPAWVPYAAWGLLGAIAIPSMWFAWSLPGAIGLFGGIAAAFGLWYKLGSRGSWLALLVMGAGMSGILGWQAATGSRCPEPGTKVFLKLNKPPVDCTEIRTSAASMSAFFAMIALLGIGAPLYARSMREDEADPVDA